MSDQSTDEIIGLIKARRTIHDYKPNEFVDKKIIKEAIEACRWAPNHHLTEPWHFYLPGKETIEKIIELNTEIMLAKKGQEAADKKRQRWKAMTGWLVISCLKSDDELTYKEDFAATCCAIQNLQLLLWEQGIGMKWSTGPVIRDERFYDLLWINSDEQEIMGIFWYGYPELIPKMPRKEISQFITELD